MGGRSCVRDYQKGQWPILLPLVREGVEKKKVQRKVKVMDAEEVEEDNVVQQVIC